jgi:hypothetical protein
MAGTWGARGRSKPLAGHQPSQQAKAIGVIERWQATARRQKDIIDRLTAGDDGKRALVAESLAAQRLAYETLRSTGLDHEQAEQMLADEMATARGETKL